jgi:pimeloyl-ACP methyl ester carboxylesterase
MSSDIPCAVSHRTLETNGIRMHVAEQGSGPLVLLCHGFPESWYSYRHQLRALAGAGFRAVAPDMRGYGQSDRPLAIDQYTLLHHVADMLGVLDGLEEQQAVIVGHDWGAPVAWHAALLRPDRFRAVVGLSVPFRPRGGARPTSVMPRTEHELFYQLYFQEPGVAEAELERDVPLALRRLLCGASADVPGKQQQDMPISRGMVPRSAGFLDAIAASAELPSWLEQADLDFYASEFSRTGFRGGLNWYRNIDRNWELLAPFQGARIEVPALFIAGEQDLVIGLRGMRQSIEELSQSVPRLTRTVLLPGCGHWTQQERPEQVNAALIEFARAL